MIGAIYASFVHIVQAKLGHIKTDQFTIDTHPTKLTNLVLQT